MRCPSARSSRGSAPTRASTWATAPRAWPRPPPTRSSCPPCSSWSGTTSWARCSRERGRASRSRRRGESVIKVERLVKWFDGQQVLHEVDLEVATGSITVIIGRSGGGKTVLLRHLIGLLRPDGGRVLVDGVEVSRLRGRALDGARKAYGVVFRAGALFDSMTCADNVAFPVREKLHLPGTEAAKRGEAGLAQGGREDVVTRYTSERC